MQRIAVNVVLGVSVVLFALGSGCAGPATTVTRLDDGIPVVHDLRPKFYLVSWLTPGREDAFALFSSDRDMYRFLDGFKTTAPHISFAALEERIARLPRNCLVSWKADSHNDIDPPRPALERRVRALTDRRAIDLQLGGILTH